MNIQLLFVLQFWRQKWHLIERRGRCHHRKMLNSPPSRNTSKVHLHVKQFSLKTNWILVRYSGMTNNQYGTCASRREHRGRVRGVHVCVCMVHRSSLGREWFKLITGYPRPWIWHKDLIPYQVWKSVGLTSVRASCSVVSDFCDPMDYTVHGILQARTLEWVVFPFSRGSYQPRDQTQVSHIAGWFFTSWATWKHKNIGVGSLSFLYQSSRPENRIAISCIAGGFFIKWAIRRRAVKNQDSAWKEPICIGFTPGNKAEEADWTYLELWLFSSDHPRWTPGHVEYLPWPR